MMSKKLNIIWVKTWLSLIVSRRRSIMARKSPVARAGNYTAPIDTAGVDLAMKESLGFGPKKQTTNPIQDAFTRWFGAKRKINTASDKSASVHRTSDIPTGADIALGNKVLDSMSKTK
jgi:hypothetical protein